jgi:hypothetical protein
MTLRELALNNARYMLLEALLQLTDQASAMSHRLEGRHLFSWR